MSFSLPTNTANYAEAIERFWGPTGEKAKHIPRTLTSRKSEKLLYFEIGNYFEVPHIVRQHGIAEFQGCGAD
jgi:hypothetical protein